MGTEFFVTLFGIVGILSAVLSFQSNRHKTTLFLRTSNELAFAVQYLLLGAYTGMAMNLVGCVRNLVFAYQGQRGSSMRLSRLVFCGVFFAMGVATWQGPVSILIIAAKIISTFAYGTTDMRLLRFLVLLTSTSWLIYNLAVGSWAGVVCEALTLFSIAVGIIRYDVPRRAKKEEEKTEKNKENP